MEEVALEAVSGFCIEACVHFIVAQAEGLLPSKLAA